jgi:hypothetical protein
MRIDHCECHVNHMAFRPRRISPALATFRLNSACTHTSYSSQYIVGDRDSLALRVDARVFSHAGKVWMKPARDEHLRMNLHVSLMCRAV